MVFELLQEAVDLFLRIYKLFEVFRRCLFSESSMNKVFFFVLVNRLRLLIDLSLKWLDGKKCDPFLILGEDA